MLSIPEWPDSIYSVYIGRHTQCTSRISLVQGSVANWQPTTLEQHTDTGGRGPKKTVFRKFANENGALYIFIVIALSQSSPSLYFNSPPY